jgi:hypothetical protein
MTKENPVRFTFGFLLIAVAICTLPVTALAQETIGWAIEIVDPSISSRVMFEAPAFNIDRTGPCDLKPDRSECDTTNIPNAIDLGIDAAGNMYSVSSEFTFFNDPPVTKYGVALLRSR